MPNVAWWPPVTNPGAGSSSARMITSITEAIGALKSAIGASLPALRKVPSGRMTLSGRKQPSLAVSCGVVRYLSAMRAAVIPPP